MPTRSIEQSEAVRRYYAAFPALKKGSESPRQYYLPPPLWCRRAMQPAPAPAPARKPPARQRRTRRRGLPEWVTHEGAWEAGAPDPVREFIRALALDEGYGTCETTRADDAPAVPDRDAPPPAAADLDLYARFEAKFDRSLEALWARDATPDDDYQELPVDLASLLASPSDRLWERPGVWAAPAASPPLHDRLRPLHLASPPPPPPPPPQPYHPPPPPELESFALYEGDDLGDALAAVAGSVRSLTAINHSRDNSGFAEVPPRRRREPRDPPEPAAVAAASPPRASPSPSEDLLTSARTHFRPIRREAEAEAAAARYADGDTFDIRGSLEPVEFRRSESGGAYLGSGAARERYLEYRAGREVRDRGIDYGRLALTAAQRASEPAAALPLPLRFPVRQRDAAAQTDGWAACDECAGAAKKMRPDAGIWSSVRACAACAAPAAPAAHAPPDELARDWEELLADISAAHAHYAAEPAPAAPAPPDAPDRKRRHSAALRCARQCAHPHARFLPCCALDRPLTR